MQAAHEFDYLRGLAEKYGHMYAVDEFNAAADNITAEQLKELRGVYAIICTGDNRARIGRWADDSFERRHKIPKREFDFAMQVSQAFLVFEYLARRGIQPFCDKEIEYAPATRKPNWETLPKELSYLIEPAEAYGIFDDVEVLKFLDNAHPKDMEMLATTAERMRLNGHLKILNKWVDQFPSDNRQEVWMVDRLVGVMSLAGLSFE